MCRHMCMGLCGAQPRDTNYKPISSLPPSCPRPHRRWNRGVGGARPPGLKVDPLLNASPSFGSIHLINSTPQVKFPSLPSSPLYRPLLNASPSLRSIHLINSAPPGKISFCPLYPTLPSLPPMMTSLASIYFYYCKSTVERHSI